MTTIAPHGRNPKTPDKRNRKFIIYLEEKYLSPTKREAVEIARGWIPSFERKAFPKRAWLEASALAAEGPKVSPSRVVAREVFTGRVDNISEGIAFVTLFPQDSAPLVAQWPARDLAKKSIEKGDLFELTMTDSGVAVIPFFRKIPRQPIPDDLWSEIQKLKASYPDLLMDETDGDGEER